VFYRCNIFVDGFTARPFDSADLAEKILDLLADPAKRGVW
jgi:hypothetical protein